MEVILGLIILMALYAVFILPYIIPAIIAGVRKHNNYVAILIINAVLGWTIIGWIVALIWSLTDNVSANKVEVNER